MKFPPSRYVQRHWKVPRYRRNKKRARATCPLRKSAAAEPAKLFEFLRHDGELQLGLGERLYHQDLGQFGSGVLGGGHFADEQVLGALEHFLFTEGERLATTEGNDALQHGGHFNERPRAHPDWKHRVKEHSERMRTGALIEVAAVLMSRVSPSRSRPLAFCEQQ